MYIYMWKIPVASRKIICKWATFHSKLLLYRRINPEQHHRPRPAPCLSALRVANCKVVKMTINATIVWSRMSAHRSG